MSSTHPETLSAAARRAATDPERLAAVRMTELLHSHSEVFFDKLTRMAAEMTRSPAAFLSLVGEGFDFYKSCYGFDEELTATREITGVTFCHYALISDGPLVIEDARSNPAFCHVPTIESYGIAAYLGVPLLMEKQALGAFCVIDRQPRTWTTEDLQAVAALARAANAEIIARVRARQGVPASSLEPSGPPAVLQRLSPRELEVLSRILAGKGTKEIAVDLGMSDKTVATHRGRLLKKLDLRSSRDLYLFAVQHRLVDWI